MSFTRRKLLGLMPFLPASLVPTAHAKAAVGERNHEMLEHFQQDPVGASIFKTYERCQALKGEKARRNAQMLFDEAQRVLLESINEQLDDEAKLNAQLWNEEELDRTEEIRNREIFRYTWFFMLSAFAPRKSDDIT